MFITHLPRISVAVLALGASAANATYLLSNLGMLPGGYFATASGINADGQVAGYNMTPQASTAVLYRNGSVNNIGTLPGDIGSVAKAISDNGAVVGYSWSANFATYRSFLYSNGSITDLSQVVGQPSFATGINNAGQVAGYSGNIAFLYDSGRSTTLGTLGATANGDSWSYAYGINNAGQVVGLTTTANGERAFLYSNGAMSSLGASSNGFTPTHALAISEAGEIVGYGIGPDGVRAFTYRNGTITTLGTDANTLYGGYYALDVNNFGEIVGHGNSGTLGNHAFLFRDDDAIDLFSLVENGGGWSDTVATGINDRGQISGYGIYGGLKHAFVLDPSALQGQLPEPSSLLLAAVALATLTAFHYTQLHLSFASL